MRNVIYNGVFHHDYGYDPKRSRSDRNANVGLDIGGQVSVGDYCTHHSRLRLFILVSWFELEIILLILTQCPRCPGLPAT